MRRISFEAQIMFRTACHFGVARVLIAHTPGSSLSKASRIQNASHFKGTWGSFLFPDIKNSQASLKIPQAGMLHLNSCAVTYTRESNTR